MFVPAVPPVPDVPPAPDLPPVVFAPAAPPVPHPGRFVVPQPAEPYETAASNAAAKSIERHTQRMTDADMSGGPRSNSQPYLRLSTWAPASNRLVPTSGLGQSNHDG